MPIYEYQCEASACCRQFEAMQKISEPPIRKCPECGSKKVSKLMSATSFVLKGSGWYQTDIARKEKERAKAAKAGGSKASSEGATAKSAEGDQSKASKAAPKADKTEKSEKSQAATATT